MKTFCQYFLLISLLLQSLSTNAFLAPFAHHLKKIGQLNFAQTIERLAGYENWASEQGRAGVYNWLHSKLTLDRYNHLPIELLGTNAHAIWWFIQHSIDEEDITPDNEKLKELAMTALNACKNQGTFSPNTDINQLLASAFNIHGNHVLGEVLLNLIISDDNLKEIPINYIKLFETALISRNYRLINLLLKLIKNKDAAYYVSLILTTLISHPYTWEDPSTESLEFDDEGLTYAGNPDHNNGGTFYVNTHYPHADHTPSEFNQILNWLQENQQQNPAAFLEALTQARRNNHHNATEWLGSIGVTETILQTEPEADNAYSESTQPQPQPEARSFLSYIAVFFCLQPYFKKP